MIRYWLKWKCSLISRFVTHEAGWRKASRKACRKQRPRLMSLLVFLVGRQVSCIPPVLHCNERSATRKRNGNEPPARHAPPACKPVLPLGTVFETRLLRADAPRSAVDSVPTGFFKVQGLLMFVYILQPLLVSTPAPTTT